MLVSGDARADHLIELAVGGFLVYAKDSNGDGKCMDTNIPECIEKAKQAPKSPLDDDTWDHWDDSAPKSHLAERLTSRKTGRADAHRGSGLSRQASLLLFCGTVEQTSPHKSVRASVRRVVQKISPMLKR
jgi:hypothetical protein